jgi:hypothetical protein
MMQMATISIGTSVLASYFDSVGRKLSDIWSDSAPLTPINGRCAVKTKLPVSKNPWNYKRAVCSCYELLLTLSYETFP